MTEYLKFGFKKGEKGSRNNTPNASSIYAQHRHHPSLCAAANHFDSNSKESLQNEVSPSKLISIKRAVVSVLIAKRFDSGNYTKNFRWQHVMHLLLRIPDIFVYIYIFVNHRHTFVDLAESHV